MTQTVLITGANRGIGLGLATCYLERGETVLGCCRDASRADQLRRLGPDRLEVLGLDVTEPSSVAELARRLEGRPVDLLINNAGIYGDRAGQAFGGLDYDDWRRVLDVNVLGAMRVAEALFENVAASERRVIATISSQMGSIERNWGSSYAYRTSKSAVNMAMSTLAIDRRESGVAAVLIHPGWVRTDMGGEQAAISVEESVAGIVRVLDRVGPADSGAFFDYQGERLPW